MKKIFATAFLVPVAALVLSACSFSKGVSVDGVTGLKTSYNGLTLEKATVIINSARANNNKVTLGDTIHVSLTGVDFFDEAGGLVFPGCTIILTDKQGAELLNLPDAFSDMNGGINKEKASTLNATLNTGNPMEKGSEYFLKARFFDKKNAKKEIVTEFAFVAQ